MRILAFLLFASSLSAQTVVHWEAESFIAASPACTSTPSTAFPAGCIQPTGDTAPPATGNQKIILKGNATFDYLIPIPVAGQYSLSARLNGVETIHMEAPVGWNVSADIVNPGSLGTFTAPKTLSLAAGPLSVRMVVTAIGAGYPSANWFELKLINATPGAIPVTATLLWCVKCDNSAGDTSPISGSIQVNQVTWPTTTTLSTFPLASGAFSGSVTFDNAQPDPLVLSVMLLDSSGATVCATPETLVYKFLLAGVQKVTANATLRKSDCSTKSWSWTSQ